MNRGRYTDTLDFPDTLHPRAKIGIFRHSPSRSG